MKQSPRAAFLLPPGSPAAAHLAAALAPGATPEDGDIVFSLGAQGGPPLARGVFSLRELAEARADALGEGVPLTAAPALRGGGGAEAVVADLVVSLRGARAVCAARGE